MRKYAWKHLVLIATLCALGVACARPKSSTVPTKKAGLPSAAVLARRAVQAYDHLHYPLSAAITLESYPGGLGSKRRAKRSVEYVRANDQSHWCREEPGYVARYVSGSTLVLYSAKTKTYRSPDTNKVELREVFGVMTRAADQFRWLLTDPKVRGSLASASVTESRVDGDPVYVIHLDPSVAHYGVISLGKTDGVIRRVEITYLPSAVSVYTYRTKHEAKPFPASTFIRPFSGPRGRVIPDEGPEPPTPPGPPIK